MAKKIFSNGNKRITIRVEPTLLIKLKDKAKSENKTLSKILREILSNHYDSKS